VAIGITGLKMETTQNLVVSFRARKFRRSYYKRFSNFKKVNVTAADFATMFDVYFGAWHR
jgi:hypothetical protein